MFGKRPDGNLEKTMDPIVRMTSYIMPKRYDAQVFLKKMVDYDAINDYIKEKRAENLRITHMDVVIAAYVKTMAKYPELNRFVVNKKIYKRNEIAVSLTVLKEKIGDQVSETTIKVKFSPDDNIFDVKDKMVSEIEKNRAQAASNATDNICRALLALPLIPGAGVKFLMFLDRHGLLPKSVIDASPFHASMFITNMASIRTEYVYHHIYDFGTVSAFIGMGRKETVPVFDREGNVVKKNYLPLGVVIDERICSGYEYSRGLSFMERLLKNPHLLEIKGIEETK